VIRDKFDWDLNELQNLSPYRFAASLVDLLNIKNKKEEITRISNCILDQIIAYVEKNTFFPRVRFCKREEEIISEGQVIELLIKSDQICVNCDSLLLNGEICEHCGFSFVNKFPIDRKYSKNPFIDLKRNEDFLMTTRQTERQRILEETKRKIVPSINIGMTYNGKEKKVDYF
jgi:hypothetical protein